VAVDIEGRRCLSVIYDRRNDLREFGEPLRPTRDIRPAHRNIRCNKANLGDNTVTVCALGKTSVLRTIRVSYPEALAFDGSGNLYVANYGSDAVTVYAPGEKTVLLKISAGVNMPAKLAFGP
jgi:DNA-binding beta-propeller fold protein YncE